MPALEPVLERIAENVEETLKGIKQSADYSVTIRAVRREDPFNDAGHLDCAFAQGNPSELERSIQSARFLQPFEIVVFIIPAETSDLKPETLLNRIWADIYRAFVTDHTRGGLANDTHVHPPTFYQDAVLVQVDVDYEHKHETAHEQHGD